MKTDECSQHRTICTYHMLPRKPQAKDECPSLEELEAYANHHLYDRRNEAIFIHIKHCTRCLRQLAGLTKSLSPEDILHGSGQLNCEQRLRNRLQLL